MRLTTNPVRFLTYFVAASATIAPQIGAGIQNASSALQILAPFLENGKKAGIQNTLLKGLVLQAVAYRVLNQQGLALEVLDESLALARGDGFIRVFVDEEPSMAHLLQIAHNRGLRQDYVSQLFSASSGLTHLVSAKLRCFN